MSTVKTPITYLERCETLVCGSTLFALELALEAARSGRETVIAMERTNPFIESISCLRSHVRESELTEQSPLLQRILANREHIKEADGRVYYNPHQAAQEIENELIESGVRFYYNAMPVAAIMQNGDIHGAVFGGKPGLFAIEGKLIIDGTLGGTVAKAAGAKVREHGSERQIRYSMELSETRPHSRSELKATNGLFGEVEIHHLYADFSLTIPEPSRGSFAYINDFLQVYRAALEYVEKSDLPKFRGADAYLTSSDFYLETDRGRVRGFPNLFAFSPVAVPGNDRGQLILENPLALFDAFPDVDKVIGDDYPDMRAKRGADVIANYAGRGACNTDVPRTISFHDRGFSEPRTEIADALITPSVPELETDLLVAGGGTSGIAAAYQAGKLGLDVVCIDNALELGGTNTVGGVVKLWFGNRTRAFTDFFEETGAAHGALNASAFFKAVDGEGVSLLLGTPVCGVACNGREMTGVYVVTPNGLCAVKAKRFIDATGDGSLAAWSGSEYAFGSERDGISLWGSFGNFKPGRPEAARQFLSMVDERSPFDATRFIVSMRRTLQERFAGETHIHPPFYLAPRTSRHIKARTRVTYEDVLAGRKFPDGISRARSNVDSKGPETANAYKAGFYPWHRLQVFEVTIPYSSLLPLNLDNVIVVGKAYSITNDALAMSRMQADLFSLGIVAAEAVNLSLGDGVGLADIEVPRLQARLQEIGALSEDEYGDDRGELQEEAAQCLESILYADNYEDTLEDSARLLAVGKEKTLALLEGREFEVNDAMARLLCYWGDQRGVDALKEELEGCIGGGALPTAIYGNDLRHLLPDHGFAPKPVFIIFNLALAGDEEVIRYMTTVADGLEQVADDYNAFWAYTFGLAHAAERLARPELAPLIEKALACEVLQDRRIDRRGDLRKGADTIPERYVYLQLALTRALARCGSTKGCLLLCDFFDEARIPFAVNARTELMAVTGQDFGYDRDAWRRWIERNDEQIEPAPIAEYFR